MPSGSRRGAVQLYPVLVSRGRAGRNLKGKTPENNFAASLVEQGVMRFDKAIKSC